MLRVLKSLFSKTPSAPKPDSSWPFDQPPDCMVLTTRHVMKEGAAITRVSHDLDDSGWQFHYSGDKTEADAMVVMLKNVVATDPSVLEVADIPPGWIAVRRGRGAPWERRKNK